MRAGDAPFPVVTLDPDACADWSIRPVIAVEDLGQGSYMWDAGYAWDDATLLWDAGVPVSQWRDATCDFTGADIDYGPADDKGLFPAGRLAVTLDNRSGRWAGYNSNGSPTAFGVGTRIAAWFTDRVSSWWAFNGRVATWDERINDTVEVEAFDTFGALAQEIGAYTPGAAGDLPGARLTAITTTAAVGAVTRFATGTVTLTAQETDQSPLEEMQTVAASDGGVLYGDQDGTVVYADRAWRAGRADQTAIPTVGTNVCTAPIVLTDPVISTSDTGLAGTVILQNVVGLTAKVVRQAMPPFTYADSGQQWTLQGEGDVLAAFLADLMWQARLELSAADLYPRDTRYPALAAVADFRLLDKLRVLHDSHTPQGVARVDVVVLLVELHHALTAETWVASISTTRAMTSAPTLQWDNTVYVWDDAASDAVWGFE